MFTRVSYTLALRVRLLAVSCFCRVYMFSNLPSLLASLLASVLANHATIFLDSNSVAISLVTGLSHGEVSHVMVDYNYNYGNFNFHVLNLCVL